MELDLLDVMDKVVVDDWREAQSGRFGALRPHMDAGRLSGTASDDPEGDPRNRCAL